MLDEPSLDRAPAAVRIMLQRVRNLNRDHLDSFGTTASGENMYKGMNLVRSLRATIRHNGQRTAIIDFRPKLHMGRVRPSCRLSCERFAGPWGASGLTIWNTVS